MEKVGPDLAVSSAILIRGNHRWLGYIFGGFGSVLIIAAILCFIAWYAFSAACLYATNTVALRKPLGEPNPSVANLALAIVLVVVASLQSFFVSHSAVFFARLDQRFPLSRTPGKVSKTLCIEAITDQPVGRLQHWQGHERDQGNASCRSASTAQWVKDHCRSKGSRDWRSGKLIASTPRFLLNPDARSMSSWATR